MKGQQVVAIVVSGVVGTEAAWKDRHSTTLVQQEHIHAEIQTESVANTTSTTGASANQFYRVVAFRGPRFGAGDVWKPLPTKEAARHDAESRGYAESDFRIETVDREGRALAISTWKHYPELSYRGIRP